MSIASLPTRMASPVGLPPLENGDRLARDEFERRWEAMPWLKKAELINGRVSMSAAAVRTDRHGHPHSRLILWLSTYAIHTPGVQDADNSSLYLDLDNALQPDAFLRIHSERGGQSQLAAEGYVEGAPELVAEVAASSASIDLHDKLKVYRRHGVREYVVWRVYDEAVDWFVLEQGRYNRLALEGEYYKSRVFPGLWLDAAALVRGDGLEVLRVLQQGIASPEHAAFVSRLKG